MQGILGLVLRLNHFRDSGHRAGVGRRSEREPRPGPSPPGPAPVRTGGSAPRVAACWSLDVLSVLRLTLNPSLVCLLVIRLGLRMPFGFLKPCTGSLEKVTQRLGRGRLTDAATSALRAPAERVPSRVGFF